jgi:hypothetical protein
MSMATPLTRAGFRNNLADLTTFLGHLRRRQCTTATDYVSMISYLALETEREREYGRQHARWLRDHANQLRGRNPSIAADYDQDAQDLEQAVQRVERELLLRLQNRIVDAGFRDNA